jgi:hypothetical protein
MQQPTVNSQQPTVNSQHSTIKITYCDNYLSSPLQMWKTRFL